MNSSDSDYITHWFLHHGYTGFNITSSIAASITSQRPPSNRGGPGIRIRSPDLGRTATVHTLTRYGLYDGDDNSSTSFNEVVQLMKSSDLLG